MCVRAPGFMCVYVCVDIMMPISRALREATRRVRASGSTRALNFRFPTLRGIARISVLSAFSAQQRRLRDAVLSKRIRNLSVSMRARARARETPTAVTISPFRFSLSLSFSFSPFQVFRCRDERILASLRCFRLDVLYTRTCHYARFIRAARARARATLLRARK